MSKYTTELRLYVSHTTLTHQATMAMQKKSLQMLYLRFLILIIQSLMSLIELLLKRTLFVIITLEKSAVRQLEDGKCS